MKKFEKINLKKKADISIKQAEERGQITKDTSSYTFLDPVEVLKSPVHREYTVDTERKFSFYPIENIIANTPGMIKFDEDWIYHETRPLYSTEKRVSEIHEELANERKYTRELESRLVSLTTVITTLMNEITRTKKQLKDQKEEYQTFLESYGEPIQFFKNYLNQMRREKEQYEQFGRSHTE